MDKLKSMLYRLLAILLVVTMVSGNFSGLTLVAEAAEQSDISVESQVSLVDVDLPENDELFAGYVEQIFYDYDDVQPFSVGVQSAGANLSGDEKLAYDALVPIIKEIAAGERKTTVVALGENLTYEGVDYTADVNMTFSESGDSFDHDKLVTALLVDCPYELYWFDKVSGCGINKWSSGESLYQIIFTFHVSQNYQGANNATVNNSYAESAKEAAQNAKQIVEDHALKADYDKLVAYRNEICDLVVYDKTAAQTGKFSIDNDPWQLIYVFDSDSTTNVVCEGYSKAFQYLCDQSSFKMNNTACYTVTGDMISNQGSGDHMWNIVTLESNNYLVDVTNCDDGTIGYPDKLFAAGTDNGDVDKGYTFDELGVLYTYDEDSQGIWGTELLTIASENYIPENNNQVTEKVTSEVVFEETSVTLTYTGEPVNLPLVPNVSVNGEAIENPSITYSYRVNDDDGEYTSGLPTDVGVYEVRATLAEGENYKGAISNVLTVIIEQPVVEKSISEVVFEETSVTLIYTGEPVNLPWAPNVSVNGEAIENPSITYSYRVNDDDGEYTSGLPTDVGIYEVRATLAEGENYKGAISNALTLIIEQPASEEPQIVAPSVELYKDDKGNVAGVKITNNMTTESATIWYGYFVDVDDTEQGLVHHDTFASGETKMISFLELLIPDREYGEKTFTFECYVGNEYFEELSERTILDYEITMEEKEYDGEEILVTVENDKNGQEIYWIEQELLPKQLRIMYLTNAEENVALGSDETYYFAPPWPVEGRTCWGASYTDARISVEKLTLGEVVPNETSMKFVWSDVPKYKIAVKKEEPAVTYKINYVLNGGTNHKDNPATYNSQSKITLGKPTRKGYDFQGWYSDSKLTKKVTEIDAGSTGDKIVYAKWIKSYTITYSLKGGTNSSSNPQTYNKTTATITLKKPTRKGYTFKGWYSDSKYKTKVSKISQGSTGNKNLYAKWEKTKYTVTYSLNKGKNSSSNPKSYYVTSKTIKLKNPTRKGYTFKGWYTEKSYINKISQISKGSTGNLKLYAKWEKTKYTITYNLKGGTNSSSNPANYYITTSTIKLKNPKQKGYTFKGWYSDSKYKTKVTKISKGSTGNKKLYAKWEKVKYTITYDAKGGKNSSSNPKSYYVTTSTITLKKPTRKGYTFGGWYKDSKYKTKITSIPKGSTGSLKLYAKWTANKYAIHFDANGGIGTVNDIASCTVGKSYKLPICDYVREGYYFKEWNTKASGKGKSYKNLVKVKNVTYTNGKTVTLYAIWGKFSGSELKKANQVLAIVNKERKKHGLAEVTTDSTLTAIAQQRAKESAVYWSHTRPDEKSSCFSLYTGAGYRDGYEKDGLYYMHGAGGENIAYTYQGTAAEVMELWMNSPGHRANILNENFTKLGIGCYYADGRYYWVQNFSD